MGKDAAGSKPAESTPEEKPAETPAGETPAEKPGAAADPKPEPKAPKSEKTFTKLELEAAKQQAIADAQKKWEADKDLSELDRIKKENEDLKAANRLRDARDEVTTALGKLSAKSPDLIWEALKGRLEFDEKGGIKNLDTLINSFKESYPEQFGVEKPSETIDGGAGGGNAGMALTKEKLAEMSPAEIQKLDWEVVKKVMAGK